jgi:hypothetical protein
VLLAGVHGGETMEVRAERKAGLIPLHNKIFAQRGRATCRFL